LGLFSTAFGIGEIGLGTINEIEAKLKFLLLGALYPKAISIVARMRNISASM
jgi:hypothetical protein